MPFKLDPTISYGALMNLIGFLIMGVVLYGRFRALETKVDTMWRWWMRRMNGGFSHHHEPVE